MNQYYPDWASYPAFIWRGWGYLGGYVTNPNDSKDDEKSEDEAPKNEDTAPATPTVEAPITPVETGMGGGDFGGGGES